MPEYAKVTIIIEDDNEIFTSVFPISKDIDTNLIYKEEERIIGKERYVLSSSDIKAFVLELTPLKDETTGLQIEQTRIFK